MYHYVTFVIQVYSLYTPYSINNICQNNREIKRFQLDFCNLHDIDENSFATTRHYSTPPNPNLKTNYENDSKV